METLKRMESHSDAESDIPDTVSSSKSYFSRSLPLIERKVQLFVLFIFVDLVRISNHTYYCYYIIH